MQRLQHRLHRGWSLRLLLSLVAEPRTLEDFLRGCAGPRLRGV